MSVQKDNAMNPSLIANWLQAATKGLCTEAQERIASEVTEHFDSDVAALVKDGRSQRDAEAEVLSRLGSPLVARIAFLKSNLTIRERDVLNAIQGYDTNGAAKRRYLHTAGSAAIFLAAIFPLFPGLSEGPRLVIIMASASMLLGNLPYVAGPLIHGHLQVTSLRQVMHAVAAAQSAFAMVMLSLVSLRMKSTGVTAPDVATILFISIASVYGIFSSWRFALKLQLIQGPAQP